MEEPMYYPIVIIGAGPVGTLLSALFSFNHQVQHLLIERETSIPSDPRAFGFGEYATRILQQVGVYETLLTEIAATRKHSHFISGDHADLDHKPFLRTRLEDVGVTGHTMSLMFYQPALEVELRKIIHRHGLCDFRLGHEVVEIKEAEGEDVVYVTFEGLQTKTRTKVKTSFVVGTDGRRGFVRKMYLEPKGVVLERTHPYQDTWLGANWDVTVPTPETHPGFPLWKRGYTPEQVAQLYMPAEFVFVCNPKRPAIATRFGPNGKGKYYWRTEFRLLDGEDPEKMSHPNQLRKLVDPYLHRPGGSLGTVHKTISFPADCVTFRHSWSYKFESRTCNKWRVGRVMLAGDSAHVFPPYGGQGLQAGFFDADGLAWRLALLLKRGPEAKSSHFEPLLDSWCAERKAQISTAMTYILRNGGLLTETNPWKILTRDYTLWALSFIPSKREQLEKMPLVPPRYPMDVVNNTHPNFLPELGGGVYWWQIYCKLLNESLPWLNGKEEHVHFTDDIIFHRSKKSLFQLVVLADIPADLVAAREQLASLTPTSEPIEAIIQEVTEIVNDTNPDLTPLTMSASIATIRPATAHEYLSSPLYQNVKLGRTGAANYDEGALRKRFARDSKVRFVVVRADRFVFANCGNTGELQTTFQALVGLLGG